MNIKQQNVIMAVAFLLGLLIVCNLRRTSILEAFENTLDSSKLYKTHEETASCSGNSKCSSDFRHSVNYKMMLPKTNVDCDCVEHPKICKVYPNNGKGLLTDEERKKLLREYVKLSAKNVGRTEEFFKSKMSG